MTDFAFTSTGGRLADGITLGAYPVENWVTPGEPSGAPIGSSTDTATFTAGAATFEGLTAGKRYWIVKTTAPYVYTMIHVPVFDPVEAMATNGMGVVVHEDQADVDRPGGLLVYTWIGSVEPVNMVENDIWIDTSA